MYCLLVFFFPSYCYILFKGYNCSLRIYYKILSKPSVLPGHMKSNMLHCVVRVDKFRWTNLEFIYHVQLVQKNGPGAPGGQSWTAEWLKFDNSYFKVCFFCHISHTANLICVYHI